MRKTVITLAVAALWAAPLLGLRDFGAFCKRREGATTVRTLIRLGFSRTDDGLVVGTVEADAFCHSMVRSLVGALIDVGEGRREPAWMLDARLESYRRWLDMDEPTWARVSYPRIDFQDLYYYAAPKSMATPKSLDEIDPKLLETYAKLGIPLKEQEILAGGRQPGAGRTRPRHARSARF